MSIRVFNEAPYTQSCLVYISWTFSEAIHAIVYLGLSLTINKTWNYIALLANLEFALTLHDFIIIVYLYKNILRGMYLSMFNEKQSMNYVYDGIQTKLECCQLKLRFKKTL